MEELSEDIGRLYGRYGQTKVQQFFKRLNNANREIPPTSNNKRAMYNFTRSSYPKSVVISPSFLRSDLKLGNDSSYNFSILKSDIQAGTVLPNTSVLLDQNDTFELTKIFIGIWTIAVSTPPPAQQSRIYSYPNKTVFDNVGESTALDGLFWGGRLLIEVGTDKIFPKVDLLRFLRVPTSQQGTVSAVNAAGGDSIIGYDGYSTEDYPWMDSVPGITISGNGKYTFNVSLPQAQSLAPVAGLRDNYMCLYLRGLLCSNGAKQQNRKFSVSY